MPNPDHFLQAPAAPSTPAYPAGYVYGGSTGGSVAPQPSGAGGGGTTPDEPLNLDGYDSPVDLRSITERFPYLQWMLGIPELASLLEKSNSEGWGSEEFEANLWATQWWKVRSSSARAWDEAVSRDPGQVSRRRAARRTYLSQQANLMGYQISGSTLDDLVEQSLRWDYTTEEMQRSLGSTDAPLGFGNISSTADQIQEESRAYMMDYDRETAEGLARRVATGDLSIEGVRSQLKSLAKANYAAFGSAIDDGFTINEATFGIRNAVAQTLERRPDDIDLRDEKYADLLGFTDDGGKARIPSLAEANRWARQQDDYFQTESAQAQAEKLVSGIGATMGLS